MKGSEAVVWATTPFGASEDDADTYETGTNNICRDSRAVTDAGCPLLGFVGGEKTHEKERGWRRKRIESACDVWRRGIKTEQSEGEVRTLNVAGYVRNTVSANGRPSSLRDESSALNKGSHVYVTNHSPNHFRSELVV